MALLKQTGVFSLAARGEFARRAWRRASTLAASALDTVLGVFAQALFSRRRAVGALILVAVATEPNCLGLGACALIGAGLALGTLRLTRGYTPYGYNALLCGIALGRSYAFTATAAGFAGVLGACSVLATAAFTSIAAYLGYIPVLALPFTLTLWFMLGMAPHLSLAGLVYQPDAWAAFLPPSAAGVLQTLAGFVFLPNVAAGICVALALLVYSRVASVLGFAALVATFGLLRLAHAPLSDLLLQATACNAALAAVALGGVWLVPSRSASLLALGSALFAAFFTLGCAGPLARLGLAPGFLPFGCVVILVLSALRQRAKAAAPQPAHVFADSPELLLLDQWASARKPATGVRITPPFAGTWSCTQGANGQFTHHGMFTHAYDFEMYSESDGSLCRTTGMSPDDFHCFAQPILAVADGTVIATESTLRNNSIGDTDNQRPFGNYVLLQHLPTLYSLVAHLSPGTVTVYPGQYVARGTVIGYCGNSGFSPRPHLHFQLQVASAIGSPTLACELSDVMVRAGERLRFEPLHEPAQGEALQALSPDYAFAALFDVPLGATLTYRLGAKLERVTCDTDAFGRVRLRSLDCSAQLLIARTETCFECGELRGSPRSVLRLMRLALGRVPFARQPGLAFHSVIPERWLSRASLLGLCRTLAWDLRAAAGNPPTLELSSMIQSDAQGLSVVSVSCARDAAGEPRVQTRARLGSGPGPRVLEVSCDGYTERAELVAEAEVPRRSLAQDAARDASGFALGIGEWS